MGGILIFSRTEDPDPLLRDTKCAKSSSRRPGPGLELEITLETVSGVCVVTHSGRYSFVSRLSDSAVTICVGNAGNGESGYDVKPITVERLPPPAGARRLTRPSPEAAPAVPAGVERSPTDPPLSVVTTAFLVTRSDHCW